MYMSRETNQMLYIHTIATHLRAKFQRRMYAIRFLCSFRAFVNDWGLWAMSHQWGQNSSRNWSGASGLQSEWSGGDWVALSVDRQWGARDWHAPAIGLDGGKGEWSVGNWGAPSIGLDSGKGEWSHGEDRKKGKLKYDNVTNLGGSKHMVPLEDRKDLVFSALSIIASRSPVEMPTFTRMAMHSWDEHVTMSMLYIFGRIDEDTPIRSMFSSPEVQTFSIEDASKTLALAFESIFPDEKTRVVITKTLIESFYEPARLMSYADELGHQKKEGKSSGKRGYRQSLPYENDRYLRRRTTDDELDSMRKKRRYKIYVRPWTRTPQHLQLVTDLWHRGLAGSTA